MRFDELGLGEKILEAISYMGFENATPIQEQTMPEILAGKDIIACAQTGTGKTAAFILPILNMLAERETTGNKVVIVCPTRELAIQIDQQIQGFTYFVGCETVAVYGGGSGEDWEKEKNAFVNGSEIIVATPGKLISHLNMGYVSFKDVEFLILDEADRMLDIGFHDDILKIISHIPKNRQTLMFSATMPPKIREFSKKILKNPFEVSIAISKPAEGVLQAAYLTYNNQKIPLVNSLIGDKPDYVSIIVFTSTKRMVSEITRALKGKGYTVEGISSDLEQKEREAVLLRFRSKKTRVIVSTDVLSRGIDIKDINLVVNFDVPGDAEDYVHRVGRTARASTTGVAITLVNPEDMYKFVRIERLIESEVPKCPLKPEFGEGPKWNPDPDGGGSSSGSKKGGKGRKFGNNKGKRKFIKKGPNNK